MGVVHPFLL
jgi:hypothetical protein